MGMAIQSDHEFAPTQIARAVFPTAFRGYDQDAVRRFLSRLAAALEHQQEYAGLGELEARTPAHERVEELEAEIEDLQGEIKDLELELVQRSVDGAGDSSAVDGDQTAFDEHRAIELLGQETARVLESARSAAADILKRAEQQAVLLKAQAKSELTDAKQRAQKLVAEQREEIGDLVERMTALAEADAERITAEAEEHKAAVLAESSKVLSEAEAAAESQQDEAEQRARQIVADAETLRQQVISELMAERRQARDQMDTMAAARDRLAMSLAVARSELDDVADVLADVSTVGSGKDRIGGGHASSRIEFDDHRSQDPGQAVTVVDAGRGPDGDTSEAADADADVDVDADADVGAGIDADVDVDADVGAGINADVDAERGSIGAPELTAVDGENPDVVDLASVAAAVPVVDRPAGDGEAADDGPPSPAAVIDNGLVGVEGPVVEDDLAIDEDPGVEDLVGEDDLAIDEDLVGEGDLAIAEDPAVAEDLVGEDDLAIEDDVVQEDLVGEILLDDVIDLDQSLDLDALSVEPGEELNELRPDESTLSSLVEGFTTIELHDELVGQIARSKGRPSAGAATTADGTVERGSPASPTQPTPPTEPSPPGEVITTVASRTASSQRDRTRGDLVVDARFTGRLPREFAARDLALSRSGPNFRRQLRRALNDDQSDVLDRLRAGRGSIEIEELPPFGDQIERYLAPLRRGLSEIAQAGARAGGRRELSAAALENLVRQLARYIVDRVRIPTIQVLEEAPDQDRERILEPIRSLYREFRNIGLADLTEDALYEAFAIGLFDSIDASAPIQWVVDPRSDPDPVCEINRGRRDLVKGEVFPSGHARPLSLPGCRCLVMTADD